MGNPFAVAVRLPDSPQNALPRVSAHAKSSFIRQSRSWCSFDALVPEFAERRTGNPGRLSTRAPLAEHRKTPEDPIGKDACEVFRPPEEAGPSGYAGEGR